MSLICTFMHHKCTSLHRNSGGAIVPLQFGGSMYFPRACILAIYADHPACVECTVTGSGCPVCHTQKTRMHAPLQPSNRLRDDANMHQRRNVLRIYAALTTPAGCKKRATKRAGHEGVPLGNLTVWSPHSAAARCTIASQAGPLPCTLEDWVFGPDRERDSILPVLPAGAQNSRIQTSTRIQCGIRAHACHFPIPFTCIRANSYHSMVPRTCIMMPRYSLNSPLPTLLGVGYAPRLGRGVDAKT